MAVINLLLCSSSGGKEVRQQQQQQQQQQQPAELPNCFFQKDFSIEDESYRIEIYLKTQSVPRSKHTPSQLYKPVS